jgi:hypothetical protein
MAVKLIPHQVILTDFIPNCDFCVLEGETNPGPYDFKTNLGPWAHGCVEHWKQHRAAGQLGEGLGQFWVTKDQIEPESRQMKTAEVREDGQILIDGPSGKQTLEWYSDSANFDGDLVDLL